MCDRSNNKSMYKMNGPNEQIQYEKKKILTIPSFRLGLMRMHRPALKPLNIGNSSNAGNKSALSSPTLRHALDGQAIRLGESRGVGLGENVDSGGWGHGVGGGGDRL